MRSTSYRRLAASPPARGSESIMVTVDTPRDPRMESIVAAFADANLRHQPQGIYAAVQVAIPDVTSEEFERAREIVITLLNHNCGEQRRRTSRGR